MANQPISQMDPLTDDLADDDLLVVVDSSDLTQSVNGTTKRMDADQIVAKRLKTTTGPTVLDIGAVADGEVLIRSGSTIIGAAPGGGTPGGATGDIQYNDAGAFAGAPLVREDADTVGLYDTSNTAENPSRLNIYGLRNGGVFERWSMYYNITDDAYVMDINHSGSSLRRMEIRFNNTNYWRLNTNGSIYALDNTASVLGVAQGSASSPGLQFGTSATGNGLSFSSGPHINIITNSSKRVAAHDFGVKVGSGSRFGWASTSLDSGTTEDTALERGAAGRVDVVDGSVSHNLRDVKVRQHYVDQTITPGGTTGNQTIDKAAGTVNIAAGNSAVTVTNNLVSTSSLVFAIIRTNDATATIKNVVPAAGSFTINLGAAATAEISIGFLVVNK